MLVDKNHKNVAPKDSPKAVDIIYTYNIYIECNMLDLYNYIYVMCVCGGIHPMDLNGKMMSNIDQPSNLRIAMD